GSGLVSHAANCIFNEHYMCACCAKSKPTGSYAVIGRYAEDDTGFILESPLLPQTIEPLIGKKIEDFFLHNIVSFGSQDRILIRSGINRNFVFGKRRQIGEDALGAARSINAMRREDFKFGVVCFVGAAWRDCCDLLLPGRA